MAPDHLTLAAKRGPDPDERGSAPYKGAPVVACPKCGHRTRRHYSAMTVEQLGALVRDARAELARRAEAIRRAGEG
jgi:hypothetical protein